MRVIKIKKLIVFGHVEIDLENNKLKNHRAMQEILNSYSKYFDEIHYIGPGEKERFFLQSDEKIFYHSVDGFLGKKINRLLFFMKILIKQKKYKNLIVKIQANYIQLRFPSLFSMAFNNLIDKKKYICTTYIAGDLEKVYNINYNFLGNFILIKFLKKYQDICVRNSLCVTTGDKLSKEYMNIAKTHVFMSTIHNKVEIVNKKDLKRILFVGRLEKEKRIEDLIDAVNILVKKGIDINLKVLGDGTLKNFLENKVKDLKLNFNIKFLGKVSDSLKMEEYYKESSLLILPSVTEGTPKVLPEGMAYGVVPIASKDVGSINEIIGLNNERGILTPINNAEELAKNIKLLIEKNDIFLEKQKECYQYAKEHTLENEVKKMMNFIMQNE